MKKLLILATIISAMFISVSAADKVTVTIPDYEVRIENSPIYYYDSTYPFISHKDVTYFPMTYEYSRALNISTSWVDGQGLYIAYQPSFGNPLPVYETTVNTKVNTAVLPEYPIYINGRKTDNSKEAYPLLNFRGVTYFPMTWDYAHEEFCWTTSWEDGLFTISAEKPNPNPSLYFEAWSDDYAIISSITSTEILLEDGKHTIKDELKYYRYDFLDETLTETDFDPKEAAFAYTDEGKAEIRDNVCYFGEIPLTEICVITEDNLTAPSMKVDNVKSIENNVWGRGYTFDGVQFYDFTNNWSVWYENGAGQSARPTYTYIKSGDKLIYIGQDVFVSKAAISKDGNIYYNTHDQLKMIRTRTSLAHKLWRLTPEGVIENVTDEFADYGSMEILGCVDGTIYLRCAWMPNQAPAMDEYQVSPVNDGYFTYDGKGSGLVKKANYIYADNSFISGSGDIFALIRWKSEIRKLG